MESRLKYGWSALKTTTGRGRLRCPPDWRRTAPRMIRHQRAELHRLDAKVIAWNARDLTVREIHGPFGGDFHGRRVAGSTSARRRSGRRVPGRRGPRPSCPSTAHFAALHVHPAPFAPHLRALHPDFAPFTPDFPCLSRRTSRALHTGLPAPFTPYSAPFTRTSRALHARTSSALHAVTSRALHP